MVEFGNSLDPDKEFDVLHGVLDFSVDDCLEEGEIAEDWDIGDAQCLGPIPSYILMELELPVTSNEEHDSASIAGPHELRKSGFLHTQSAVSVLERSGSCSREKSLSIKSDNAFPARRSKRLRDKRINPELSTSKQTLNPPQSSKKSRKRLPVAMDLMRKSPKTVDNSLNVSDRARQSASESCPKVVKKCAHCQSSKTTNWRGGPLGPMTLCNACGLRYRSGRLCPEYRPLLSPTFVPSQHSKSHKKVAEMRKEAKRLKVEIKTDGVPEQTQLHAKTWVPPSPTCVKTSFEMQLQNDDKSLDRSDRALLLNDSNPCPLLVKKCAHCESTKTPLWKKGPLGPSALCNACGIRYGAGRLVPEYQPHADVKIAAAPELRRSGLFHTQSAVSVLERSGNCSRQKSLPIKSDNAFPARRSKRLKDKCINPELSTSKQTSNLQRSKESRKRLPVAMGLMRNSPKTVDNSLNVSDRVRQTASESCPKVVKKCAHCQSSKTTLWRGGPLGPRTLCNACGLRYRSGRLCPEYRPLLSPTFVPSQHSNSHKKVAEMRNEAKQLKVEIKTDGFPEQTQLHAKPWVPPSPTCVKTSGEETSFEMQLQNDDKSLDSSDRALLQNGSNPCPPLVKKCAHCESTKTPLWKKGPLGPSTLCNACGIRYEAGRLVPEYRPRQYQPRPHQQWSHADVKRCCAHCETTNTPRWMKGPLGPRTLCNACGLQYGAGHLVPEYRPRPSPTFVPSQRSKNCRTSFKMRAKTINDFLTADKNAGAPEQQHVETSTVSLLESNPSYFEEMHVENDDKPLDGSDCVSLQNGSNPAVGKKCAHCQSTMTPLWRSKPLGPYALCNACGLQYQAGCLVLEYRPSASPTFVPSMHSNDRRDMKTMQCAAGIKIDEAPELAYHVAASSSFIHQRIDRTPEQKQVEQHVDTSSYVENGCSYSKHGPEHVKHMGGCVSPPSPCKKTSSEEKLSGVPVENDDDNSDGALLQNASGPCPAVIKKCTHCQSTKTLRWRKGPLGPQRLCDACGQRYLAGCLVPENRPKASVTIMPSQHSKDCGNIEKMMQSPTSIEIAGAPEQQHVEGMQPAKHVKTSTRVSLLESSPTYLRYKAKYFKDALCVPPPSPCKKTSSVENDDDNSDSALVQSSSNPCPAVIKKCTHCESTKTPEWRKGPLGPSTLCTACNHQYRAGRLLSEYRPKASPTFVPGLHLNKRRDILIKMQSTAGIEKRCAHCESTKTPQWTWGPSGPSTLCTACGHQYRVGRLVPEYQPRGSPTSMQASIPAFPYKAREDETEPLQ